MFLNALQTLLFVLIMYCFNFPLFLTQKVPLLFDFNHLLASALETVPR